MCILLPEIVWIKLLPDRIIMKLSHVPYFIIKDLPLMLILIITDQILKDSLCCSNKYN